MRTPREIEQKIKIARAEAKLPDRALPDCGVEREQDDSCSNLFIMMPDTATLHVFARLNPALIPMNIRQKNAGG